MFQKLNFTFFQKIVRRSGAGQQVEAIRGMQGAQEAITQVLGEECAADVKLRHIKQRVLVLETTHPAISANLKRAEQTIIAAVNRKLGRPEVVAIQFILPYK